MQDATEGQGSARIGRPGGERRLRFAVVGTPRSGNTWLRHLLALAYDLRECGFPFPDDVAWDGLPDRCVIQVHGMPTEGFLADLDRHGFFPIIPARHPLDVLISLLSFATQRFDPGLPGRGVGEAELPIIGVSPRDPAFLNYAISEGDQRDLAISAAWWNRPDILTIRYEDLVANTEEALRSLVSRIESPPRLVISEVVRWGQMEEMRKRETFRGWPHHFFQGRPGLWRSVLPASEARAIASAHASTFETLGYECDPDEGLDPRDADMAWFRLQAEASRRFAADERANVRRLRADLAHECAGHDLTRVAYENAKDQIHRVNHLLYDERVSSDLIQRDAAHWRARAEAAERSLHSIQPPAPPRSRPRLAGRLLGGARSTIRALEALLGPGNRSGSLTSAGVAPIVAGNPPSAPDTPSQSPGRSPHGPSRHLVHRPVGRPDPGGHLPEGRPMGLRRYRASLLGRPFQRPKGPE